nr:EOG090X0L97 [Leptodora kindtii]
MASDTGKKQGKGASKSAAISNEEIVQGFHKLRAEQRQLVNKLSEVEMDLNEHKLVIETLQSVDKDRRCYRMVGGVLVERTVKEVTPALTTNRDQMIKLVEALNNQISIKGQEILDYKNKHNIQFRKGDEIPASENDDQKSVPNQGVLVGTKP